MNLPQPALDIAKRWAQERLREGTEPPWAYYRLMQLVDAIDALSAGSTTVSSTAQSQEPQELSDDDRPRGAKVYRLDAARHHPADPPVQLPM